MTNLTNYPIEKIIKASQGNPGAIRALMEMLKLDQVHIIDKIIDNGILGTDIYILFNDLCDFDAFKVFTLVEKCPMDILKDACSRQDRSGKKLIEQYL